MAEAYDPNAPIAPQPCMRCARTCTTKRDENSCWVCEQNICIDCWEEWGVCAASRCVDLQYQLANARTQAERARIMLSPGPIGAGKKNEH